MSTRIVPVTLKYDRYDPVDGLAVVVDRSPAARVGRAAVTFAIFLFCAFIGVFVPVAHFVLVPGFLILGIVMAALKLKESESLVEVRGKCPRCKDKDDKAVPESGPFRNGRTSRCNQCAEKLTIVVKEPAATLASSTASNAPVSTSTSSVASA